MAIKTNPDTAESSTKASDEFTNFYILAKKIVTAPSKKPAKGERKSSEPSRKRQVA
jgi:hypothetical protein